MQNFTPFMSFVEIQAIILCLKAVKKPLHALEWGSGNSTIFFSPYLPLNSHWFAIEHNKEWSERVLDMISEAGKIEISLKQILPSGIYREGIDDGDFSSFKNYILYPTTLGIIFDVIFVDGRARVECMKLGWKILSENGVMILHDAEREEYTEGIPKESSWVRMTNMASSEKKSVVFMSKSASFISQLTANLRKELPAYFDFQTNSTPAQKLISLPRVPADILNTIPKIGIYSCLFLNTYYDGFLTNFYKSNPEIANSDYQSQKIALQAECFGDSDFYSTGFKEAGWNSDDIIVNVEPLQNAWKKENSSSEIGLDIAIAQIRQAKPDVLYIQDMNLIPRDFILKIRDCVGLIVGQIATPIEKDIPLDNYDLIFTSFPHYVEKFRKQGITAYYQALAFDSRVLNKIQNIPFHQRQIECSFVGGISNYHVESQKLLDQVAKNCTIDFWGYGAEKLVFDSKIRKSHHGEVWGIDMFSILQQSNITINRHGEIAGNFANNMRLFEATGCGALLITDYKENLNELFVIGQEIVAYRSPEEAVALIKYYQTNPEKATIIAEAGQKRTLQEHSYTNSMQKTAEILELHLRHKNYNKQSLDLSKVSFGHTKIDKSDVSQAMTNAWKDQSIPQKQRILVQNELSAMYKGETPLPFKTLAAILKPIVFNTTTLLEIGCASGYYYEILSYLLNKKFQYCGVDYSESLITLAKEWYPKADFKVADGSQLPFSNCSFDVVISSCILLHTPNYHEHIAETARVASKYIIAHRTPICRNQSTYYVKKFAYEVETVELIFNENEFIELFKSVNFQLIRALEYESKPESDQFFITYLFERKP